MEIKNIHPWDLPPADARQIQERLRERVIRRDCFTVVRRICGVDVGFRGRRAVAACVVMSFPGLEILEQRSRQGPVEFPYVPGLLSFREIPPLAGVLQEMRAEPDLIIADGQGIAHPRGFGLASHLGVLLNRPAIGCAKSRLIGTFEEPGAEAGSWTYLYRDDEIIGAVLRTRDGVRPVFVSIGHMISLHSATSYVLKSCRGYRITEPVRAAHKMASST
jgi:deoxyribonuclease V